MIVGERLRVLREERNLSQGEVEKRTGLLCCYISRVEHGHTVPAVETLEKFARTLEVPVYQLFYDRYQLTMFEIRSEIRISTPRIVFQLILRGPVRVSLLGVASAKLGILIRSSCPMSSG